MAKPSERGFALLVALWLIAALAVLVSVYARYADDVAVSARLHEDDFQIEAAERSAIEMTAGKLIATSAKPARGAFSFSVGEADVTVEFVSEAARIDLNGAPASMLGKFFIALGADPGNARAYAQNIVAWRKRAEGDEEADAYKAAGLSYAPRHAPFQDTLELSLVRGLPPDLVIRALPYFTVFDGEGRIDARTAPPIVLSSLPDLDSDRLARLLAARADPGTADGALLTLLGPARAYVATAPNAGWRVFVAVRLNDGRRARAEIVILPTPKEAEPFRTLAWSDN